MREKSVASHTSIGESSSADFALTPAGGTWAVGGTTVTFPPNVVCDPRVSGYGPTEWDKPCVVLRTPIAIHADAGSLGTDGTATWVRFIPELRFTPAATSDREVWIQMRLPNGWSRSPAAISAILWVPTVGAAPVDEALGDPGLRTVILSDGYAARQIKHFSGYVISTGYDGSTPPL
ncbi:MAG: hypothetical protein NVS4B3_17400 [Gemmatimonadaceae bacterium]